MRNEGIRGLLKITHRVNGYDAEPINGSDACVCHAGCGATAAPAIGADQFNVRRIQTPDGTFERDATWNLEAN
jgi:hypothetical protein